MATVIITSNLENEIRDIRTLEAKINELEEKKKEKQTPIKLSTKEEARRAFIYSEIFNRKY